ILVLLLSYYGDRFQIALPHIPHKLEPHPKSTTVSSRITSHSPRVKKNQETCSHRLYIDLCVCSRCGAGLFRETRCAIFPQHDPNDSWSPGDLFPHTRQNEGS